MNCGISEHKEAKWNFKEASAGFDGKTLKLSTGLVERVWRLEADGLATVSFSNLASGFELIPQDAHFSCDWSIFMISGGGRQCNFLGVDASVVEASILTSDHLLVTARFQYPESKTELHYSICAYPGVPGFRTQVSFVAMEDIPSGEKGTARLPSWLTGAYTERICADLGGLERFAFGYYCDSQHRFHTDMPILKEDHRKGFIGKREIYDWANGLALENSTGAGVLLVKESHKCVNQSGLDSGAFVLRDNAVMVTGLGLSSLYEDKLFWLRNGKPLSAWANWSILYEEGGDGRQFALKRLDRARFPFRQERDTLVMANTWGSRKRDAIEEGNLLKEIDSCADLGIDLLQIDSGWYEESVSGVYPPEHWTPSKVRLPSGWAPLREKAERAGLSLGLWFDWNASVPEILRNREEGGFRRFKLDYSVLNTREVMDPLLGRAYELLKSGGAEVGINWDVTEEFPRIGYYFARDFGNLFLQNCEIDPPGIQSHRHILYEPWLILRQAWQLSKYMNLNQVQLTIQDVDRSDFAGVYGHAYCFAITMMGIPLFFQETNLLSQNARMELKPLIRLYKKHREKILSGFVSPIGDEPDNASITGFLCRSGESGEGYLTVFREAGSKQTKSALKLPGLNGMKLVFENLLNGTKMEFEDAGVVEFEIPKPASFLFMKYVNLT